MSRIPERMTDNDIVSGPDTRMPQLKREPLTLPVPKPEPKPPASADFCETSEREVSK